MSKSKNNGVDPEALVQKYGADTARLFMMFASPPEQTLEWSDSGVEGAYRFLRRLWSFAVAKEATIASANRRTDIGAQLLSSDGLPKPLATARREIHVNLQQANRDLEKFQFNTVASAAMKVLNALERAGGPATPEEQSGEPANGTAYEAVIAEGMSVLLRVLSPVTPHVCHYLWRELGFGEDILASAWPQPEEKALATDEVELVIQVNGKLRSRVSVPADADEGTMRQIALADTNVVRHIGGKAVKKVVIVPGRLINIVI
jgi:leucyl-tRNA synthetase